MAYFGSQNYTPMDQEYHQEVQHTDQRTDIEKPIFPIHMIGQTVPDVDPATQRNVIQGVDAAFKAGAANIQLVMMQSGQAGGMGGGPKAYGEEVREAIRELQKASGSKITGVELPNSITNLTGYDPRYGFNEEQRRMNLDEVRDSIKFVGDIAGGGGVDVISWEFPRNIADSKWAEKEGKLFKQREEEYVSFVDTTTGKVTNIDKKRASLYLNRDPNNPEKETEKLHRWMWGDFQNWGKKTNQRPEELLLQEQIQGDKRRLESDRAYAEQLLHDSGRSMKQLGNKKPEEMNGEEKEVYNYAQSMKKRGMLSMQSVEEQERRLDEAKEKTKTIMDFGEKQAAESYAQAGLWAWQESQKNKFVQHGKGSIYVGPEMGWPHYYGSHPQEWVDLILKSRNEMVDKLTKKEIDGKENPYYEGISKGEAEKLAKTHIRGELDTGHLGMWMQNFRPELSWDKRMVEFKKWYKGQIEWIADQNKEHDIIGGIQAVDSATGAHGHLPAGQGILGKDIFEYMKILKEKGNYKGEITSEGHEEERLGHGRILTKAWEAFGSPIGTSSFYGRAPPMFRDIRQSYAQIAYGTTGIFQSYVPSNDFTLWSNVPLE